MVIVNLEGRQVEKDRGALNGILLLPGKTLERPDKGEKLDKRMKIKQKIRFKSNCRSKRLKGGRNSKTKTLYDQDTPTEDHTAENIPSQK